MKRLLALALLIGLVAVLIRVLVYALLERPGPPLLTPVQIDVEPGQSFRTTAEKLESAGLVPSGEALVVYARLRDLDRRVHYGAYEFREPMRPVDLIDKMVSGEVLVHRVTIPEGRTLREIAATLDEVGLGEAEEFLALARDPAFARSVGVEADTLEGYLFPETYFFSPYSRKAQVLGAMVGRFRDTVGDEIARASEATGLTPHEVVTLASIVEKETAKPEERPLIAAVFRNRLKIGMPLQADPTVIYGIEGFDGNLTRRHLETPTPYNTYRVAGLPPGPIASPGREAIRAVLAPADVPYLYFVARDDGSHEFSATLAEHNRAVNRWQRRRG